MVTFINRTKQRLQRRTVLRGALAGSTVCLALPCLDAMLNDNGDAYAQGDPLPSRFGVWFFGHDGRAHDPSASAQPVAIVNGTFDEAAALCEVDRSRRGTSLGQITETLFEVGGKYRRSL